jgi:transposase
VKQSKLPSVETTKKSPDLNEIEKWNIIAWCMQYFDGEKMAHNTYTAAAQFFDGRLAAKTIKLLCLGYLALRAATKWVTLETKKHLAGRPSELTDEIRVNIIDLHVMTGGKLAELRFARKYEEEFGVKISQQTIGNWLKEMGATKHRTYLAPALSDKQKLERLKFISGKIEWGNQHTGWR